MASQIAKRGIATTVKSLSAPSAAATAGGHGKQIRNVDCIITWIFLQKFRESIWKFELFMNDV